MGPISAILGPLLLLRNVEKPQIPTGLGSVYSVDVPEVSYPLPMITYAENNGDSSTKYSVDDNPVAYALKGINTVWQGTTDSWQEDADGNGPGDDDWVTGDPIVDSETWEANIAYVVKVTNARTEDQTLRAFLDDRRSKNYSVIDGFGPLTDDFEEAAEASYSFTAMELTDILENSNFYPEDNDDVSYGGSTSSTLGDVVKLAYYFRQKTPASTSGSKYVFSLPRPWRLNDSGELNFQGVESYTCYNVEDGADEEYRIDSYETSVSVVPGLACVRRAHSSSKESAGLYTTTTENRRKDGSYPSGHTNAGMLASLAYAYAFPQRYAEMVVRGSDLGEDRILAGMHSPVDVIGGRIQALMVATYGLYTYPDEAAAAYEQAEEYFGAKADTAGMDLYDYAHRDVESAGSYENGDYINIGVFDNNFYQDHDTIKELYAFRMTYGLPQTGTTGLDPIVPEQAELLLATRQPYLTAAQRRAVIATTEVDSGYPLLDSTNGWGRINLVDASDGYGSFDGDVTVTMDASQGGYNAQDWWRNDIDGTGMLVKQGTGTLSLTGDNSYSGGTILKKGTLEAESQTAFGSGDVYVTDGTLLVNSSGALTVSGNLTLAGGQLKISMDDDTSQIETSDVFYIDGGTLSLDFSDYSLSEATNITLVKAAAVSGKFASVTADGYSVTMIYHHKSIVAHVEKI